MDWTEQWRRSDRAEPSEIPAAYGLLPNTRTSWMKFAYFSILLVLYYGGIATIGAKPELVVGVPVLQWLGVTMGVLYLLGMYTFLWNSEIQDTEPDVSREPTVAEGRPGE